MPDQIRSRDVSIIIRSCGERTEQLCQYSVLQNGADESQISILRDIAPFSAMLKKSYELALKKGSEYTFFVDADMVLLNDALSGMLGAMDKLPDTVFFVNPLVYDYITGCVVPNGPHLYRTVSLERAVDLIPKGGISTRPETDTTKRVKAQGLDIVYLDIPIAMHDFEQYYRSIFRKTVNRCHKARGAAVYLSRRFKRLADANTDFKVASLAIDYVRKHDFPSGLDYRRFEGIFESYNIGEKRPISDIGETYERLMADIKAGSPGYEYWGYTKFMLDDKSLVGLYRRKKSAFRSRIRRIKRRSIPRKK